MGSEPKTLSDEGYDDDAFDEFLRTDPDVQNVLRRKALETKAQLVWDEICSETAKGGDRPSREIIADAFESIAESVRTLLIEVVKGIRDYYQAEAQTTGSANRAPADRAVIAVDEIIAALEAAKLKQDSESVR